MNMKISFILFLLLSGSSLCHCQTKFYVGNNTNIYAVPGKDSIKTGEIKQTEKLIILDSTDTRVNGSTKQFFKIENEESDRGWIESAYLVAKIFTAPSKLQLQNDWAFFYPIGLSDNGDLAFYSVTTNSFACDGLPTYFFIYNIVTNSLICSLGNGCPKNFWKENFTELQLMLNKYKIIGQNDFQVYNNPSFTIQETDEGYGLFYNNKLLKELIHPFESFKDPDYIKYLGSINNKKFKKSIHLLLFSEYENEIVFVAITDFN